MSSQKGKNAKEAHYLQKIILSKVFTSHSFS